MKTKTENKTKKLDKTNMNIPELKWEFPSKGISLRESSIWNPSQGTLHRKLPIKNLLKRDSV